MVIHNFLLLICLFALFNVSGKYYNIQLLSEGDNGWLQRYLLLYLQVQPFLLKCLEELEHFAEEADGTELVCFRCFLRHFVVELVLGL